MTHSCMYTCKAGSLKTFIGWPLRSRGRGWAQELPTDQLLHDMQPRAGSATILLLDSVEEEDDSTDSDVSESLPASARGSRLSDAVPSGRKHFLHRGAIPGSSLRLKVLCHRATRTSSSTAWEDAPTPLHRGDGPSLQSSPLLLRRFPRVLSGAPALAVCHAWAPFSGGAGHSCQALLAHEPQRPTSIMEEALRNFEEKQGREEALRSQKQSQD